MKLPNLILFCVFTGLLSYGSNPKIDSLKTELSKAKKDTLKIKIYNEIAFQFIGVSYDSILPYSQKAINLSTKANYPIGKGIALKHQSIYYFYAGNQNESINKIEEAIQIFKDLNDNLQLAKAYQNYGVLLKNQGNTNTALEKYKLSTEYHQRINNKQGIIDNLVNSGNIYQNQGEFDKALEAFEEATIMNREINDLNSKASILTGEGLIADKKGDFELAIQKLKESLKLFEELENVRNIIGMNNNLANISRKQGNYLEAISYFENALTSAEETNNPRLQAIILNNLANTYLNINDDEEAARLYMKAIAITKDIDKATYASLLSNLAIIQTNQKQYETALQTLDSSLKIYTEQGNNIYIANTLSNIAHNHFKLDNISESKNYYKSARRSAKSMGDQYTSLSIYNGLGEIYLKENQLDSAYYFARKAYEMSKKIEALPEESSAAELLYKVYKTEGKSSKALEYLELYAQLKDSLFDDEKSKELGKLEAELEFKSLKEQLELERRNEILENKVKVNQRENFIIGLSITLFGLIIVLLLLLKIKKNKTKANLILNQKNREIETNNIKLNESNIQKNKLFSIISHDLRSPVSSLSQIFEMYSSNQITEEEFKKWIPEINKNLTSTRLLIDNLLNWASESLNGSNIAKEEIHLNAEIESIHDFFFTPMREKNLSFENKLPPGFKIYMDANALKLVIRNLISNAIKFCNSGDTISISAQKLDDVYRVCIQDTGVGMPDEVAKTLFSNSSIISSVGTRKEQGKGIGTVLCTTYVEENGGRIWVDYSETGKGTRICFEVPAEA